MAKRRFSPQGEAAVKWAELTAAQLGHSYVGSEHLLLGVVRTEDPKVMYVLTEEQLDEKRLFQALVTQYGSGTAGYYPLQGLTTQARLAILVCGRGSLGVGTDAPGAATSSSWDPAGTGMRRRRALGRIGSGPEPNIYQSLRDGSQIKTLGWRNDKTTG